MIGPRNAVLEALRRPGMGLRVVERSAFDHEYWNGRLLVWSPPERGAVYVLGVDVAEGVGGDRSVVEVVRVGDRHRPDEQVAEWASDFHSVLELATIINAIGQFYCEDDGTEALVIIECNGVGDGTLQHLRYALGYSNFFIWKQYDKRTNVATNRLGWWTNPQTRRKLVARGIHGIARGDLILHSPFLLDEMADFQRDHFMAKAQARAGTHDDRVMALLMAYWAAHDDELMAGEDVAEERRLLAKAADSLQTEVVASTPPGLQPAKPDWFNQPVSFESMATAWDTFLDE